MEQPVAVDVHVDPDNVEAMLAAELTQMTVQEREKVYEELHGIETATHETQEMLATCLAAMDLALQRVPNRAIYDEACYVNARYVEDPTIRLMFLRSEKYNAERSASRFVTFLENKVKYFGNETLARPVYLSDLNEDDTAFLKSGILQLIPERDQSGRVILADFNGMDSRIVEQPKDMNSYLKALIYIILAAAEDEETQKRGLVVVFYFSNALLSMLKKTYEYQGPRLLDWLPIKLIGVHFCYNDSSSRILYTLLLLIMGKARRVRVRVHEGSSTECQYKLMTFGIPVSSFPLGFENELKTTSHLKWISRRLVKESALKSGATFYGIDLPRNDDVLMGRGKTLQNHSGNRALRKLIVEYLSEYRSAPRREKANVVLKVLMTKKLQGGRFLMRQPDGWWMEVSDEAAREKISMSYRTNRISSGRGVSIRKDSVQRVASENNRLSLLEPVKGVRRHEGEESGVADYSAANGSPPNSHELCSGK